MESNNNGQVSRDGLSFAEIWLLIKKFYLHIICIILAIGVLGSTIAILKTKPSYTASATVMINYIPDTSTAANDRNALLYSLELSKSVEDLLESNLVRDNVTKALMEKKVEGVDEKFDFRKGLSLGINEDSVVLTLKYSTKKSKDFAVVVVNQVVDSLIDVADETDSNYPSYVKAARSSFIATSSKGEAEVALPDNTKETELSGVVYTFKFYTDAENTNIFKVGQLVPADGKEYFAVYAGKEAKAKFPLLNDSLKSVDNAKNATTSSKRNMFILLSFVLGIVVACAYIVIRYLMDDTIKSRTELERITGFKAIAFIEDIYQFKNKKD